MKNNLQIVSALVAMALWGSQAPPLTAQQINRGPSNAREHGYEEGYRDGYEFGRNSQVSNRDQDIVNQRLRAADQNYQPAYGPREEYRTGYTEGFRAGMDDSRNGRRTRLGELFRGRDDRVTGIAPEVFHGGPITAREHGYEHGYRDGYEFGRTRVSNRDQDIINQRLRAADQGYLPAFGLREEYRAGYAEGFRSGMEDSRSGRRTRLDELFTYRDPFDPDRSRDDRGDDIYRQNNWSLDHIAKDIGYRDGFNTGIGDRSAKLAFQPRQHMGWRTGLHGYAASLGSQPAYRRAYRTSYEAGYRDGFGSR